MTDNTAGDDVTTDENEIVQEPSTEEAKDTSEDIQEDGDKEVVTEQPKKNKGDGKKSSRKKKRSSKDGCISAAAGVGSISRDYLDGAINAEYVGPNADCMMSCAKFPDVVTKCTLELCSANFVLGLILCKCGLALDTKIVCTDDGMEAEAFGTGVDFSEGIAVGALGTKIGIIDKKKRDKKWKKKRQRWQKKKKKGKKSKD
ncbi:uncharacterized protein LOC121426613, partial [Lytechinus variegatus]|uniref:uncharacterized protein LOC121426613 n=1 Tax=Lytechinus variegatus TaxID=7654 RepID=UPI001BB28DF5